MKMIVSFVFGVLGLGMIRVSSAFSFREDLPTGTMGNEYLRPDLAKEAEQQESVEERTQFVTGEDGTATVEIGADGGLAATTDAGISALQIMDHKVNTDCE